MENYDSVIVNLKLNTPSPVCKFGIVGGGTVIETVVIVSYKGVTIYITSYSRV